MILFAKVFCFVPSCINIYDIMYVVDVSCKPFQLPRLVEFLLALQAFPRTHEYLILEILLAHSSIKINLIYCVIFIYITYIKSIHFANAYFA